MKESKVINFIVFCMELGTMFYFIPLLIYLAEYSFGIPGTGFLVGILGLAHYYIYKWYRERGSLIMFGITLIFGAIGTGLAWVFEFFHSVFFPAQYLFYFSTVYLPSSVNDAAEPLLYYFLFLTCVAYTYIGRMLLFQLCKLFNLKICNLRKTSSVDID